MKNGCNNDLGYVQSELVAPMEYILCTDTDLHKHNGTE